jgi:putative transposase
MSIRATPFVCDEYYHIYNRGVNKMKIFIDYNDYDRFLKLLYSINNTTLTKFSDIETIPGKAWTFERDETLVDIGAFCLMPNHFHLLLKEKTKTGITIFLHRLATSYSTYFNKKYKRNGSVFQGKFKSEHIKNNRYLKYLFSYIHLNPIKLVQRDWKEKGINNLNKTKQYLNKYKYSSYFDYKNGKRNESKILNSLVFPNYFPTKEKFEEEIFEWLIYNNYGK